jgi:hypothetical protein
MVVSEESDSDSESQSDSDSDLEFKLASRADSEVLGYVPVLATGTPDSGCSSVPDFNLKLAFRRAWSIEAFEYDCTAMTADSADWDWTAQVALLLD